MYLKTHGIIEKRAKLSEGEVEFTVSTGVLDAHGEKINVDGISIKDFKKNPVVLWAHDSFNLPIAKATKVWKEGGKLMARAQFYLKDDFPRKVYGYIVDGYLNAVSIGGMVEEWGEDGITINKLNMKEFSVVPIPANQEALVANKSLDLGQKKELKSLANLYARQVIGRGENELLKMIDNLESIVATLKELVPDETEGEEVANKLRVVLRQAQAVDNQAEEVIKNIKVTLRGRNE